MTTEAPPSQQSFAAPRRAWQRRLNEKLGLDKMPVTRRLVYSVLGVTVLLIGIAMIVLPGPAVIVIPVGLAILASEYAWARRFIRRGKVFVGRRVQKRQRKKP
ncbi:MAG: PGPGW domain-containing protein [Chthoniobacterales bacterium]